MGRNDLLLIGALLLLAGAAALAMARTGGAGAYVQVTADGETIGRYPLGEDRTVTIGTDRYNILEIRAGGAAVVEANCHDFTCVRTGRISQAGERIVCLPHRLVVEVVGGQSGPGGIDAAAGDGP